MMSEKTGFDVWYDKQYNNAQKEATTFKRNDLRMAWEEAWRISIGLVELGVEHAWKEGYVVGFQEGKTHNETN